MFNCAHTNLETCHDMVDLLWLLLQGCGPGFSPIKGTLNGFSKPIKNVLVIRSTRTEKGGREQNEETWNPSTRTWTISIGDCAESWAKAIGKLLAGKYPADVLIFDLSNIRPAGGRLSHYGWVSSGDTVLAQELPKIAAILNRKAGKLLSKIDILDIANHLGVVQTGRRGAEICLVEYDSEEWEEFARAKADYWKKGLFHRSQSNNSLVFYHNPGKAELLKILTMMYESGGSEPGFINAQTALARAPWFKGVNPCAEILLSNKGFCNLVEVNIAGFENDTDLHRALWLVARANYRQTCVNLDDGVLQRAWHENNEFLRLCGVGLCGIARRPDLVAHDYRTFRNIANAGAYSMADELGLPRPKNTTTIKPGGTLPKVLDTTEGCSKPLGQYIFNNINFSMHDPIVEVLREARYHVFDNPDQPDAVIVRFPVKWEDCGFVEVDGKMINADTAIDQLELYKMLMDNYVDQNCSITVYYKPEELEEIAEWIDKNWSSYVGVSFLQKPDATKSAKDLGFQYLPQEVVTEEEYNHYVETLKPVDLSNLVQGEEIDAEDACATGVCPVR